MRDVNKHGLRRHIPVAVARAVRQRDGFGCVVCGNAFYEYDHFDPPFSEAEFHSVDGIILLCLSCHGRKTRRLLSHETIAAAARRPKARQKGFSFGPMDIGVKIPDLHLGPVRMSNCSNILNIDGQQLLSIEPPEGSGGPFRLNAIFYDLSGAKILEIVRNECRFANRNWDVSIIANRIVCRKGERDISLSLRSEPPNKIVVELLTMSFGSSVISIREGRPIELVTQRGVSMFADEMVFDSCTHAITVHGNELKIGAGGSISLKSMIFSTNINSEVHKRFRQNAVGRQPQINYYQMFLDRKNQKRDAR